MRVSNLTSAQGRRSLTLRRMAAARLKARNHVAENWRDNTNQDTTAEERRANVIAWKERAK